jgi:hypothetical protein
MQVNVMLRIESIFLICRNLIFTKRYPKKNFYRNSPKIIDRFVFRNFLFHLYGIDYIRDPEENFQEKEKKDSPVKLGKSGKVRGDIESCPRVFRSLYLGYVSATVQCGEGLSVLIQLKS